MEIGALPPIEEILEAGEFSADDISIDAEIEAAENRLNASRAEFLSGLEAAVVPRDGDEALETAESYLDRFQHFVRGLNLRHFNAQEFLVLGASNASGRCSGSNHFPPASLWSTLATTACFADAIRARLGHSVIILSAYRSEAYNACIGGATRSQHKRFCALDIVPRGTSVSRLWEVARAIRAETPSFAGGIGRYGSFVHIDTRGNHADWVG